MNKLLSLLSACVVAVPLTLHAQAYPSKPVRIVVASTPGSALDVHARILGSALSESWRQPVLMEYKPGASMMIGAEYTAKAAPDGYTLFFSIDAPFVVNPVAFATLPYSLADFAPISFWSINPFVLVVNASLPANNMQDLVALLRSSPGKYNGSSASATTVLHHELLKALSGSDYQVINYKGGAEAIASLAAGDTQIAFYDLGNAQAMVKAGKIRVLAQTGVMVRGAPQRSKAMPDVPTIAESGVPGFEGGGTWGALFAPAKTPQEIITKVSADVRRIIAAPDMSAKLLSLGVEPHASSPEELGKYIADSTARWSKLVKDRNIKITQ